MRILGCGCWRAPDQPANSTGMKFSNDNTRNPKPMPRFARTPIEQGRWIGRIKAVDPNAAIEAAAVEFKTDARRLIAVRRREIA
jgi:hypothetical protein